MNRVRALALLVLAAWCSGTARAAPPSPLARFEAGVDFEGVPLAVTYDSVRDSLFIVTLRAAYELPLASPLRGRGLRLVDSVAPEGRVFVPPGGGAVIVTAPDGSTWTSVDLDSVLRRSSGPRELQPDPRATRSLIAGDRGQFTLIGRPLDDPFGDGRWEWFFWYSDRRVRRIVTDRRDPRLMGPSGRVVAFFGTDRVSLFATTGRLVHEVPGIYRKAAVSRGGGRLLLNDANAIQTIVIVRDGKILPGLDTAEPVHGLRISPNGEHALAWFDNGVIREVDLEHRRLGNDDIRIPRTEEAFISSAHVADNGHATVGLLLRSTPASSFDTGWIMKVRLSDGRVLWRARHDLEWLSATVPQVVPAGPGRLAVRDLEGVSLYRVKP